MSVDSYRGPCRQISRDIDGGSAVGQRKGNQVLFSLIVQPNLLAISRTYCFSASSENDGATPFIGGASTISAFTILNCTTSLSAKLRGGHLMSSLLGVKRPPIPSVSSVSRSISSPSLRTQHTCPDKTPSSPTPAMQTFSPFRETSNAIMSSSPSNTPPAPPAQKFSRRVRPPFSPSSCRCLWLSSPRRRSCR